MKFQVRRTSVWDRGVKPIEGAKEGVYYPPNGPEGWTFWYIDIDSLDELLSIVDDGPGIVIEQTHITPDCNPEPEIELLLEIYDDYRE